MYIVIDATTARRMGKQCGYELGEFSIDMISIILCATELTLHSIQSGTAYATQYSHAIEDLFKAAGVAYTFWCPT